MKPILSLRMAQHLALTPQLQQAIGLLQLSTLELNQEIEQMLDDNPFLERVQDEEPVPSLHTHTLDTAVSLGDRISEAAHDGASQDDGSEWRDDVVDGVAESWEGDGSVDFSPDDGEWGGEARAHVPRSAGDTGDAFEWTRRLGSLTDHLHRQALSLRLSDIDRAALEFLIGSLDEEGYLHDSLEALATILAGDDDPAQREELLHHLTVALRLLQSLEPVGVGARNLAECLRLQCQDLLRTQPDDVVAVCALQLCDQPLAWLAKRDVKRLVAQTGRSPAEVRAALQRIARLEPKPGRAFVQTEQNIVVPDVIVVPVRRPGPPQFRVQLNTEVMPKLRVHDVYANALRTSKGEGAQALQQRLQEARWFIKNVQQRFDTLLRVSRAIVERQKHFFTHGALAMQPLVLREIADALGMHESTISRVTTAKYMATPQGTFELKYFFGSGLGTDGGHAASSTAVRALIKQWVSAENPAHPLSDSAIAQLLKAQGIDCARRTVAKYREALKIAPTHLRKAL